MALWSKIVLIGAGGVAESLLANLTEHRLHPITIFNRDYTKAEMLAEKYSPSTEVVRSLSSLPHDADCYIFALSDNALSEVAEAMPETKGIWMHTAAAVPLSVLTKFHAEAAVFYPLNTFSRGVAVPLKGVPLFYEASTEKAEEFCKTLGGIIGMPLISSDYNMRSGMHVAAVFACNFVNHLFVHSQSLMAIQNLPFNYLLPLIEQTIQKASTFSPFDVQTGPARRHDTKTLEAHRKYLASCAPQLLPLYDMFTASIEQLYV